MPRLRIRGMERPLTDGSKKTDGKQLPSFFGSELVLARRASSFGRQANEEALIEEFGESIDVVVDYLWGETARTIISLGVRMRAGTSRPAGEILPLEAHSSRRCVEE